MFVRVKRSGNYKYLQIVHTYREGKKVKQRVVSTLGRLDQLQEKRDIESIAQSISKFSESVLLVLTGKSNIQSDSLIIGPVLVFRRLWEEAGLPAIFKELFKASGHSLKMVSSSFIDLK